MFDAGMIYAEEWLVELVSLNGRQEVQLLRKSLGAAAASLTIVTLAAQANAAPLAYEFIIGGSPDMPAMSLHNMSAPGAEITGFSITIGNIAFNYDMVWAEGSLIDSGAPISATLDTPDTSPDAIRSDVISFSGITGFDAGDKFFFRTDLDPDSVARYRRLSVSSDEQRWRRRHPVVSDSWWKFDLGVAPSPNGHSIMRRGQGKARLVRDRGSASHRRGAWWIWPEAISAQNSMAAVSALGRAQNGS